MTNVDKQAEAMQRLANAKEGQIVSNEDMDNIPSHLKQLIPGGAAVVVSGLPLSEQLNPNHPHFEELLPVFHRVEEGWRRQ